MKCLRLSLLFILLGSAGDPTQASTDVCEHRSIAVGVVTANGSPAVALLNSNFAGTFHRKPLTILSAELNQKPIRVILLVDTSGSMQGTGSTYQRDYALLVAEDIVSNLPPDIPIGLGYFSSTLQPVLRPTLDRQGLLLQLEGLRSHPKSFRGETALWDAVLNAVGMFDRSRTGDVLYAITDGGDTISTAKISSVEQTLTSFGIRLDAFVFQTVAMRGLTVEALEGPRIVANVARDTGGTILTQLTDNDHLTPHYADPNVLDKSGKPTELGIDLAAQLRQLTSFYQVEFDLPEKIDRPQDWKLSLTGLEKSQRENITLTYPHRLLPCSPANH
jgi:hypothetical protein